MQFTLPLVLKVCGIGKKGVLPASAFMSTTFEGEPDIEDAILERLLEAAIDSLNEPLRDWSSGGRSPFSTRVLRHTFLHLAISGPDDAVAIAGPGFIVGDLHDGHAFAV